MSVDAVVRGAHSSKIATSGAASVGVALGWASLTPSTRRRVKRCSGREPKFLGFENREDRASLS
jgi:hypothetical protein